jgi:hypothetical protein
MKWSWPEVLSRNLPGWAEEDHEKPQVRIPGVPADTRNEHLLRRVPELYF